MFLAKSYCDIGNSQSSSSTVAQDGEITTTFEYDGIQRLVSATGTYTGADNKADAIPSTFISVASV